MRVWPVPDACQNRSNSALSLEGELGSKVYTVYVLDAA
jgi:hypothetical protein